MQFDIYNSFPFQLPELIFLQLKILLLIAIQIYCSFYHVYYPIYVHKRNWKFKKKSQIVKYFLILSRFSAATLLLWKVLDFMIKKTLDSQSVNKSTRLQRQTYTREERTEIFCDPVLISDWFFKTQSKSNHSSKDFSNVKFKSKWSPKNLKIVAFSKQKSPVYISLTQSKV